MDSKDIINHIRHFFNTADQSALDEVFAAASIKVDGDVSLEEYLTSFSNQYEYVLEEDSNCYQSEIRMILSDDINYRESQFEGSVSQYATSDLRIVSDDGQAHKGELSKLIKTAA